MARDQAGAVDHDGGDGAAVKGDNQPTLRRNAMRLGSAMRAIDEARIKANDVLGAGEALKHLDEAKKLISTARTRMLDMEREQQGTVL